MASWRMKLEVPSLPSMKEADGFYQLWKNLNNDHVYVCERLFGQITGHEIYLLYDPPEELWPSFRDMLNAIEKSVYAFNYIFDTVPIPIEDQWSAFSDLHRIKDWVSQNRSRSEPFLAGVMEAVLEKAAIRFMLKKLDLAAPYRIDDVFSLTFTSPEDQDPPPTESDFFISYKHALYSDLARELSDALVALGFSCWLDRERLGLQEGDRIDPILLKKKLKTALKSARCTVFFETQGIATADENYRGEKTVFNWQVFEHRYANDIVYVRPSRGFPGIDSLAKQLATRLSSSGSPRKPASLRRHQASPPPLTEGVRTLEDLASGYFGTKIDISPRAGLALLAPGEAITEYQELVTTPGDILINLLRYSPYCGLILAKAGLDLRKLFAVGVELNNAPWSVPSTLVFEDVFGGHIINIRSDEAQRVARMAFLTETSLLATLFQVASSANSYARELLVRTLRFINRKLDEQRAMGELQAIEENIAEALCAHEYLFRDQQWEIHPTLAGWTVRPVAPAGLYRVTDLEESGPTLVRVHAVQKGGVFPSQGFTDFENLLSNHPSPADLETFLGKSPELAFVLGDPRSLCLTTIYEVPKGHFPREQFFLEKVDALHSPGLEPIAANEETLPSRLLAALKVLKEVAAERDGALEKAWREKGGFPLASLRPRTALILGRPMELRGATPGEAAETVSLFDLHTSVLAPLWEYQQIRDLDYDSF